MDYAVMLYFEDDADQIINNWISALTGLGLNNRLSMIGMKPHLTLAEFNIADIDKLEEILMQFANETFPLNLKFSSLGIFPGNEAVFFLSPVVSEDLVALHNNLNKKLEPYCEQFSPLYAAENWVAHCTLALDYSVDEINKAYDFFAKNFIEVETKTPSLVLYGCCPYHEMSVFSFKPAQ